MAKISVEQALMRGKSAERKGQIEDARQIYAEAAAAYPGNARVRAALQALPSVSGPADAPPREVMAELGRLFNAGQLQAVLQHLGPLVQQYPNSMHLWNLAGVTQARLGDAAGSVASLRRALAINPNFDEALNNLGTSLKMQGDLHEAIMAYRRAAQINPQLVGAQYNLGNALRDAGHYSESIPHYRNALKLKPNHLDTMNNLGMVLTKANDLDGAQAMLEKLIELAPARADAHANLGVVYQAREQMDKAITHLERALDLEPNHVEALNNLGVAFRHQGDTARSIQQFKKALRVQPTYVDALNNMGLTHSQRGEYAEAAVYYRQAVAQRPTYAEGYVNLAMLLASENEVDEARQYFETALRLDPANATTLARYGQSMQEVGKLDEARHYFEQAIAVDPNSVGALFGLGELKKYTEDDPAIPRLLSLYAERDKSTDSTARLCFALYKAMEDIGRYDEAFRYLSEGNAAKKASLEYTIEKDRAIFDEIYASAPAIRDRALTSKPDAKHVTPIFIIGMPRSGTTLLEQITSIHPLVTGAGELGLAPRFGRALRSGEVAATPETIAEFRESYLSGLDALAKGRTFVTDKLPHNFQNVGLICAALPEAKLIFMDRSPAAVCWSNYKQIFAAIGLGYSYDLADLTEYYRMFRKLMVYWRKEWPGRIYQLNYETLTTDQEAETRRLIDYLGLPWDDACLSPHKNERGIKTASVRQVREKVYTGSSEAWRKYETQLAGAFDGLPRD